MGYIDQDTGVKIEFALDQASGVRIIEWTLHRVQEPIHWHPTLELCYCLSGHGTVTGMEKRYEIGPGDIILMNNTERHTSQSKPGEACNCLVVCLDVRTIQSFDPDLLLPFIYDPASFDHLIPAESAAAQEIGPMLQEMNRELQTMGTAYQSIVKSLLFRSCALLLRHYEAKGISSRRKRNASKFMQLQPALAYIQEHYQEPLQLDEIARVLALSPSRTRHLFLEVIGERFKAYLLQIRIQEAVRLLSETDMTITDIYLSCGFQSSTSFYREFKKLMNRSPQNFRHYALVKVE
ncbi:helix-turn-helix domain-containing protein [Paenibacillus sp. GCM10027626]|uniref:helix-turn-helix domain-containing protein n=1 Tax=Paenibacillus sp. GCM10027626 TaxID=3273411 RepID=UPI0036450DC9